MSEDSNPYAAPSSNLEQQPQSGEIHLRQTPQSMPAGRGWGWIAEGFQYFKRSPGGWILGMLVGLVFLLLNLIPIVGQIIYMLGLYVMVGGVMLACHGQSRGEPFNVGYMFATFKKPTKLILLSLLITVLSLVIMVLAFGPSFVGMMTLSPDDPAATAEMLADPRAFLLQFLIAMLVFIPLSMAIWFAPVLIVVHDMSVVAALKMSFSGCLKNILPFLVFGILSFLLYIIAFIPIGLGLLVFLPSVTAASYVAYREIFTTQG